MMGVPPVLLCHICAGTVGLLAGAMTLSVRKGSDLHRLIGNIFFVAMLILGVTGAYIAYVKPAVISVVVGLLTCYLVATAWRAARRTAEGTGAFDYGAIVFVVLVGVAGLVWGWQAAHTRTHTKDGYPAAAYFIFGVTALLCGVADVRMIVRGGVSGARRIARHLWRMCLALLVAILSFFPGQQHLFPAWLKKTNVLFIPHILIVGLIVFWLWRVRRGKTYTDDEVIVPAESDGGAMVNTAAGA